MSRFSAEATTGDSPVTRIGRSLWGSRRGMPARRGERGEANEMLDPFAGAGGIALVVY